MPVRLIPGLVRSPPLRSDAMFLDTSLVPAPFFHLPPARGGGIVRQVGNIGGHMTLTPFPLSYIFGTFSHFVVAFLVFGDFCAILITPVQNLVLISF